MPKISSEAARLLLGLCESAPVAGMLRTPQDKVAVARAQSELAEALQPPPPGQEEMKPISEAPGLPVANRGERRREAKAKPEGG